MTENQLEMDILSLYDSNLVACFSINQISKSLGKAYPYINKKVTGMLNEQILKKIVIGNSYLCSLNLENEKTVLLLSMLELQKRKDNKELSQFIENNRWNITIHTVFQHKKQLVFIIENLKDRRKVDRHFPGSIIVDKKEFLDLISEEEELFRKHTVLYGTERFFELLKLELDQLKKVHSPLRF